MAPGGLSRDRRVAPEAVARELGRDLDRILAIGVDHEDRPGESVLRPTSVGRRTEPGIAPGAGPGRVGIDLRSRLRLLVGDERGERRALAVDARLPPCLPEDFVATEEREIDAGVARRLDVGALRRRPVLVVADGQEGVVLEQLRATPGRIGSGDVADVVAVALEPANHRVFAVEEVRGVRVASGREGAVVAHLVRAAGRRADVERVAAVAVVGLPGRVGGLYEQFRAAVVVADHEDDVVLVPRVRADELADVDAGDCVRRDVPRGGLGPGAAVDEAGGRLARARGLGLREAR